MIKKTAVIGGGAAGMFAAITAAASGCKVTLFEKNDILGKKLLITGKGRCNVTNNSSAENLMRNIPRNPKFMFSAFDKFNSADTIRFFEECGVALKTERGNRVFPVSDKSSDIVSALVRKLKEYNVETVFKRVTGIICRDGVCLGLTAGEQDYYFDSVIICTGGVSYPKTGSTGDGYVFAKSAGHKITQLKPSLVPLEIKDGYVKELQGLTLKNINFSVTEGEKTVFSEFGEMLFTHFGISGPVVLSASSRIKSPKEHNYTAHIDLKPALSFEALDCRLVRDFSENINRQFKNSLDALLPQKIIPVIIRLSGIPEDLKVNQISKQHRTSLCKILKDFNFGISGFRPIEEAIITSGGVDIKEINPKTMESKLVKGLYFAGEVIDVDGYTGGYNLQIAFSTAYAAGMAQIY